MIRANGSLVLGQDQDSKGGKFEAHQSFIGEMTGVNIWDHVIKDQEIARMSKSCLTGVGNVFQWREFKAHIKGSVKIIEPSCWSENIHDMICEHCEGCYIKNNLWKLFVDNLMCAHIFSFFILPMSVESNSGMSWFGFPINWWDAKQKPFAPWRRVFSCPKQFACFTVSFYVCVGFLISLLFSLVEKLQSCKMQTSERIIKILLTPYLAILPTSLGSNNK